MYRIKQEQRNYLSKILKHFNEKHKHYDISMIFNIVNNLRKIVRFDTFLKLIYYYFE